LAWELCVEPRMLLWQVPPHKYHCSNRVLSQTTRDNPVGIVQVTAIQGSCHYSCSSHHLC